jgi:predicted NUDIX family NTP pyrophosphohydrolase
MKHAAGIFLVRKDGKILIGHPSGHDKNFYSIPKGKMDGDETPWQGAMRETYEETNIDLQPIELDKIYELKMVKYKHGRKCIHPFVIFEAENNIDFNNFEIKCNAFIPEDASWNSVMHLSQKMRVGMLVNQNSIDSHGNQLMRVESYYMIRKLIVLIRYKSYMIN